jgi:hypothetical protein
LTIEEEKKDAKENEELVWFSILNNYYWHFSIYAFLMLHFLTNSCLFSVAWITAFRTRSLNAVKFVYKQKKWEKKNFYYFIDILLWHHQHFFVMFHNYFVVQYDVDHIHVVDVHYIQ